MRSAPPMRPRPGCPRRSSVVGWPVRWRWRDEIRRPAVVGILVWPKHWCTRCRTRWPRWSAALSEWRATLIARESACLDVEDRRRLDAELYADMSKLD